MSQRAYAKHRGCSLAAVQKAIRDGRLAVALVVDGKGVKKIVSVEAADNEWKAKTKPPRKVATKTKSPEKPVRQSNEEFAAELAAELAAASESDPSKLQLREAHRRLEIEKWLREQVKRKSEELDLAKRTGELVPTAEAKAAVIADYTVVKTKLLGLPIKAAQHIPELTVDGVEILERLMREALEALSIGD